MRSLTFLVLLVAISLAVYTKRTVAQSPDLMKMRLAQNTGDSFANQDLFVAPKDTYESLSAEYSDQHSNFEQLPLPSPNRFRPENSFSTGVSASRNRPIAQPRFQSNPVRLPNFLGDKNELGLSNLESVDPDLDYFRGDDDLEPQTQGGKPKPQGLPVRRERSSFPDRPRPQPNFEAGNFDPSQPIDIESGSELPTPSDLEPTATGTLGESSVRQLDALGPEPSLPDFSKSPLSNTELQESDANRQQFNEQSVTPSDVEYGHSTEPHSLLSSGLDGMVDQYVGTLLQGGRIGNSTSSLGCESSYNLAGPMSSPYQCAPICDLTAAYPTGWYARASGLALHTLRPDNRFVSFDGTGQAALETGDLDLGWSSGIDGRLGFRTGNSTLELGWLSLFPSSDSAIVNSTTNDLTTGLAFDDVGLPFGPAISHQIENQLEIHSLSARYAMTGPCLGKLRLGAWWGIRFLRLREELQFGADLDSASTLDDALYSVDVDNRLFGPNFGGVLNYSLTPRLSLLVEGEVGIYYNYIDANHLARNDFGIATFTSGPNTGQPLDTELDDTTTAFVSDLNIGLEYEVSPRLRITTGYRFIALSGIARSHSQLPTQAIVAINQQSVSRDDGLILHGFQFGLDFAF